MRYFYIYLILAIIVSSCQKGINNDVEPPPATDPLRQRAAEIASAMDDRLLAAQLLISGVDGRERLSPYMKERLLEIPTGGIMLFRYNLNADNDTISAFLSEISSLIETETAGIPPFIAVDHEGGTVHRFNRGVAALPPASYYRELAQKEGIEAALITIEIDSLRAGRELKSLGVNMNFAPVAEHLTDENRSFLQRRSYGTDPVFTGRAASAFIRGMDLAGVMCVLKHFPGSAGPDPHYSASVINKDKNELDLLVSPFYAAIADGARAVMAAHTLVPAVDSEIASLSYVVMQNWLRDEIGFNGLIISDDFIMAAVGNIRPEEAAVRSINAGADMVLVWPAYLRGTHEAILESVSRERLLDAATRVIYEKLLMGF